MALLDATDASAFADAWRDAIRRGFSRSPKVVFRAFASSRELETRRIVPAGAELTH